MSVDLLSRDHGYASERRSAEARFALSLREMRGSLRRSEKLRTDRDYWTKTGWDRRRRSVGIGDEDRLESATIRVRRESENMRYLDEILLEGENDIGDRYKFRLSSMNI